MRLKHKLALMMVLAAAAPIALVGGSAVTIAARSAIIAAEDGERRAAQATAARVAAEIERVRLTVRLFARRSFDFSQLSTADALAAEKLLYSLDDRFTTTSILRADGSAVAPSYYRRPGESGTRHEVGGGELADHAAQIPLADALAHEEALSAIYRNHSGGVRLAVAAACEPSEAGGERIVVVAEVALDDVMQAVAPAALLFDAQGRLAVGKEGASRPQSARPAGWGDGVLLHEGAMLGSFVAVPGLGWGIGTQRPLQEILAPVRRLRASIALWAVGFALGALVVGVVVSRGITRPLEHLATAAREFGAGRLDRRVDDRAYQEVALVARSFNTMAEELSRSQAELRRWNAELEDIVRARTAELRDAIDQLLLAHRLAAIGQLGAGVAHEINHPLTYLCGALQMLPTIPDGQRDEMIAKSLQSARRIQDVVRSLLQVSQPEGDGRRSATDMNSLIDNAVRLCESQLAERGVQVERDLGPQLPRIYADSAQIIQALVQILNNARDAMPGGGVIRIETRGAMGDKLLMVKISDTGPGIAREHLDRLFDPFFTTNAQAGHKGLGLSLAYRIMKDHGGSIYPENDAAGGTRFVLRLPALPRAASNLA